MDRRCSPRDGTVSYVVDVDGRVEADRKSTRACISKAGELSEWYPGSFAQGIPSSSAEDVVLDTLNGAAVDAGKDGGGRVPRILRAWNAGHGRVEMTVTVGGGIVPPTRGSDVAISWGGAMLGARSGGDPR